MKKILVLAIIAMVSATAVAQISWNVKGGINLSSFGGEDLNGSKLNLNYQVGVGMDYALSKRISIQPSLLFITKGAKYHSGLEKTTLNPQYIELPIMAAYKYRLSDKMKLAISAGPYIAYGIGGKFNDEISTGGSTTLVEKNIFGDRNNFTNRPLTDNRLDYGLGAGAAIETNHFIVGLNASSGLKKILKDQLTFKNARNVCYSLSVGYKF
jgi:hypothetical protein